MMATNLYFQRHKSQNDKRTAGKLHFIKNTTPERATVCVPYS